MSKQQNYQHLSAEYAPDGEDSRREDYGFAGRLPQAGGSYQTDSSSSGSSGAAGVSPMAYPAPAYAGAPVTGYPVMTPSTAGGTAGPVRMGVEDPLGRGARRGARRQGKSMAGGAQGGGQGGGRRRGGPLKLIFGGPAVLVGGLVRRAIHLGKNQLAKQHPAPAAHTGGSSNQ